MEAWLGYLIYGVGGLVIMLFLGSALLNQRREAHQRAEAASEIFSNDENVESLESSEEDPLDPDSEPVKTSNFDASFDSSFAATWGSKIKAGVQSGLRSTFQSFQRGRTGSISKTRTHIEPEFETAFTKEQNAIEIVTGVEAEVPQHKPSIITPDAVRLKEFQDSQASQKAEKAENQNFLSLLIVAPRGQAFYGEDLLAVFERVGLMHGKYHIFHCLDPLSKRTIFSVASAIKPGIFELNYMQKYTTPGLNFFMDLSSSQDLRGDFRKMLGSVYEIATDLEGEILDSRRQRLTQSSVSEYLAKIKGIEASARAFV